MSASTPESTPPRAAAAATLSDAPPESTAAPWRVTDEGHAVRDACLRVIAHVRRRETSAEMLANACLIAASPALFAALIELHDAAVMVESVVHGYAAAAMSADLSRKMAAARAVIAAAEGRS